MKNSDNSWPTDDANRRAMRQLAVYVFATILVSSVALLFNVALVYAFYSGIAQFAITEAYAKKIGQLLLLIGPFALLFPEWLLYDLLVATFRQKR